MIASVLTEQRPRVFCACCCCTSTRSFSDFDRSSLPGVRSERADSHSVADVDLATDSRANGHREGRRSGSTSTTTCSGFKIGHRRQAPDWPTTRGAGRQGRHALETGVKRKKTAGLDSGRRHAHALGRTVPQGTTISCGWVNTRVRRVLPVANIALSGAARWSIQATISPDRPPDWSATRDALPSDRNADGLMYPLGISQGPAAGHKKLTQVPSMRGVRPCRVENSGGRQSPPCGAAWVGPAANGAALPLGRLPDRGRCGSPFLPAPSGPSRSELT